MNEGEISLPGKPATCVVVLGPFRSGTSLVARMLSELGVDFGDFETMEPAPDRYNPTGYFQHREVALVNRHLIGRAGGGGEDIPDPEAICSVCSADDFRHVRKHLRRPASMVGLKDPRFCATLLAWWRSGVFGDQELRLVRVSRDLDRVAASCIRHREVGAFCDFDLARARSMGERLDSLAVWHVDSLELQACHVVYEDLLEDPARTARGLAEFVGTVEPRRRRSASRVVGKRRALLRHYAHKARHPSLAWATARKTMRTVWRARRDSSGTGAR